MKKIALNKETIRNLNDRELVKAVGAKPPDWLCNPFKTRCDDNVSWVPGVNTKDC